MANKAFTKNSKKLLNIKNLVKGIHKQSVEIGYFQSQGRHISAEYSYAALAQAIELGFFPVSSQRRAPMPFMRTILNITGVYIKRDARVKKAYGRWASPKNKNQSPKEVLNAVGEVGIESSRKVFGNPVFFPQAHDRNRFPLVTTGDLRNHFTYRNSINKLVRKV